MKLPVLALVVLLAGCSTAVPVKQKFPDAPAELMEKCPDLQQADLKATAITDLLKVVVSNYQLYYQCSVKQDNWTIWYKDQKSIFDKANK